MTSSKALGTNNFDGAQDLDVWICYQEGDGAVLTVGTGVFDLRAAANTRQLVSLSATLTGLAPGDIQSGVVRQVRRREQLELQRVQLYDRPRHAVVIRSGAVDHPPPEQAAVDRRPPSSSRGRDGRNVLTSHPDGPENPGHEVVQLHRRRCRVCRVYGGGGFGAARGSGSQRGRAAQDGHVVFENLHEREPEVRAAAFVRSRVVHSCGVHASAAERECRSLGSQEGRGASGASASEVSARRSSGRRRLPRRCRAASTHSIPTSSTATIRRSAASLPPTARRRWPSSSA